MSWMPTSSVSSMRALLTDSMPDEPRAEFQLEDIRQAMLDTLDHDGWGNYSYLECQVLFASGLMDLWFLRCDLMQAISSVHGESLAVPKMREISSMFDGLLPEGLASQTSPLEN